MSAKMWHQNDRMFVQNAMIRLRHCASSLLIKLTSTVTDTTPGIVTVTNTCVWCRNIYRDRRTTYRHGNGDTVREGVVICTPWSYPSILHVLTAINISNQSPCCLNTCEPCFRWTGEMQNWGLDAVVGNAGGEATENSKYCSFCPVWP